MPRKKTTAYKLSIYISSAITIVLATFIVISYQYGNRILKENIEKSAIGFSSELILKVRDNVVATQEITSNLCDQIPFFVQHNNVELLVTGIIKKYPFVQAIHVELDKTEFPDTDHYYSTARIDNEIIYQSGKENYGVCEVEKQVYDNVINSNNYGWTEPFYCKSNKRVVSAFIIPIVIKNKQNKMVNGGYIAVELSLNYLNKIISNTKIGEHGYAFLVSPKGTYITHPDDSKILTTNTLYLTGKDLSGAKDTITTAFFNNRAGATIAYPSYLQHEKSWVYYTPIIESSWTLVIIRPHKELYHDLNEMLSRLIIISLLGLGLIFLLVTFIISKLMSPISQLISDIFTFSHGDDKNKSKNEVESLDKSLSQMQIWVKRNKLNEEQASLQFKKFSDDLEQASEIQQSIIPNTFPPFPERNEVELFSIYKPALVISGDLYDYFFVDDDHLLLAMGDVSGKGIPAALFMGVAHTLLQGRSFRRNANEIAQEINDELAERNQNQFFLTLFVAILNVKTGILNYCNAAHTSSKILRQGGEIEELTDTHGLPLGLYTGRAYHDSTTKLEAGDTLILYTDGVTDLVDEYDTHFGEKRFKDTLPNLRVLHPIQIIESIENNIDSYRNKIPLPDDLSMVVLKFQPK